MELRTQPQKIKIDIVAKPQYTDLRNKPLLSSIAHPWYKVKTLFFGMPENKYEAIIVELLSQYREVSESLPHNVPQLSATHAQYNAGLTIVRRPLDFHNNMLFCVKVAPNKEALNKAAREVVNCGLEASEIKNAEIVEIPLIVGDDLLQCDGQKIKSFSEYEINSEVIKKSNFKVDVYLEALQQAKSDSHKIEKMQDPVFSMLLIK